MPDVFLQKDFQLEKAKEKGTVKTVTGIYAGLSLKHLIFLEDLMTNFAGTIKRNQRRRTTGIYKRLMKRSDIHRAARSCSPSLLFAVRAEEITAGRMVE